MPTKRRPAITGHDLMDAHEVAAAFDVKVSSLQVAMSTPSIYPSLAARLPAPLRKIGKSYVWLRADVEDAVRKALASLDGGSKR